MSAIINEYELSIWKDVWDTNGQLVEEKSATLSTDNFSFPGKAINIQFKTKINGTHELTFDLPMKYVEPATGKKTLNYLRELIDNETKVKLYYKNEWYSFYVKKVTEKREKNYMLFSYSCEDSFITELSKTGYKLTFNEYAEHYIEDIHTFGEAILDGSEWRYDDAATRENCDLKEYVEEKLVRYTLQSGATLYKVKDLDKSNKIDTTDTISPPANTVVYGFDSEKEGTDSYDKILDSNTSKAYKQVIYKNGEFELSGNTIIDKNCNYIVLASDLDSSNDEETESDINSLRYGLRVKYSYYTIYNDILERYVKVYSSNDGAYDITDMSPTNDIDPDDPTQNIYSYTKTHIFVPELAIDYAANGKDMIDTTGWKAEMAVDKLTVDKIESGSWAEAGSDGKYGVFKIKKRGTGGTGGRPEHSEQEDSQEQNSSENEGGQEVVITNVEYVEDTQENEDVPYIKSPNTYAIVASKLTTKPTNSETTVKIINSGPHSRNLKIDVPTTYAVFLDYSWRNPNNHLESINPIPAEGENTDVYIHICVPTNQLIGNEAYKGIVTEVSALDDDGNYDLTPIKTIAVTSGQYYLIEFDNMDIAKGLDHIFIQITIDAQINQRLDFCIKELKFFEAWNIQGSHTVPLIDSYPIGTNSNLIVAPLFSADETGKIDKIIYNSAAKNYETAMEKYNTWKQEIAGQEAYTLITPDSVTTGEVFEEELYFKNPSNYNIPTFTKKYVTYIDITEPIDPESQNSSTYANTYKILYSNQKYRTLKQEKSNRFNLSQQLSELFHVYPVYKIEYNDNGSVKKDNTGRRLKWLYYSDQRGGENKYGFKYGHNLNSISRTIDSSNIVTKMFVSDNTIDYAKDGICTIARAKDNIGKDTYLLRFEYFINRNLISREQVNEDLYNEEQIDIIYYSDFVNDTESVAAKKYKKLIVDRVIADVDGDSTITVQNWSVKKYKGFLRTIGAINTEYDALTEQRALLEKYQLIILESTVQTYTAAIKGLREQLSKQRELTRQYQIEGTNKLQAEYAASCERIASKLELDEIVLASAKAYYSIYLDQYNSLTNHMAFLLYAKKLIEDEFNSKYEYLLKEGVWQDSKYYDDNAYYLDAEKVLVDSCGPKIQYNLSVTDLSSLEKYKFTDFGVGDVTYVEDYEFFGDDLTTNDKFYTERTIVSSITYNLDQPSKNSITLQNYSTKFDDLFSRITASVQSLSFNENIYQRAANFLPDGRVAGDSLQGALNENNLTIIGTQDVVIDSNGILVTDLRIPSNKVKIVGSGVYLTADGGTTWYGALENGGLNASLLTVGVINTQKISIYSENYSNFVWDRDGITAYSLLVALNEENQEASSVTGDSFVRFSPFGLYFDDGEGIFEEEQVGEAEAKKLSLQQRIDEIIEDNSSESTKISKFNTITNLIYNYAPVAVTRNGFSLNSKNNHVLFSSENGIVMKDGDEIKVKIGHIEFNDNPNEIEVTDGVPNFYGLYSEGAYISGKLWSGEETIRNITVGGTVNEQSVTHTYYDVKDLDRTLLSAGQLQFQKTIIPLEDIPTEPTSNNNEDEMTSVTTEGTEPIEGDQVQEQIYNVEKYPLRTLGALKAVLTKPTPAQVAACENEEQLNGLLNNLGLSLHLEDEGKFFSIATREIIESTDPNQETIDPSAANAISEESIDPTVEEEDPEPIEGQTSQPIRNTRAFVWRILYKGNDNGTDSNTLYLNCNVKQLNGFTSDLQSSSTPSDKALKSEISYLSDNYVNFFDRLQPCTYKFNSNLQGGRHIGLIAQDVQEAIQGANLENEELALLTKDNQGYLGLRYDEILTISIAKIKQLEARIKELESKVNK